MKKRKKRGGREKEREGDEGERQSPEDRESELPVRTGIPARLTC